MLVFVPHGTLELGKGKGGIISAPSIHALVTSQDAKAFKGDQGEEATGKVHAFWFATDKAVHSSRLKGALEDGAERNALWQRLIDETMPRVRELQAKIEGKAAPAAAGGP